MEGAEGWKGPVFRTRDLTGLYRTGEVEVRALDGVDDAAGFPNPGA